MVRLYVGSYAFIARIPFIKWEAFLTSVERCRTGLAYQILAIVPCKENKRLYSIDGNANPHISYIILHVKHLVAATSALMDRQKIRNLVICWCIHRLVGCLHLEKCFIRRHIPFCGRFHTGLFYEKKTICNSGKFQCRATNVIPSTQYFENAAGVVNCTFCAMGSLLWASGVCVSSMYHLPTGIN